MAPGAGDVHVLVWWASSLRTSATEVESASAMAEVQALPATEIQAEIEVVAETEVGEVEPVAAAGGGPNALGRCTATGSRGCICS